MKRSLDDVKKDLTSLYRISSYRGNTTIVPDEDQPEYEQTLLMVASAKASASAYYFALLQIEMHIQGDDFDINSWDHSLRNTSDEVPRQSGGRGK